MPDCHRLRPRLTRLTQTGGHHPCVPRTNRSALGLLETPGYINVAHLLSKHDYRMYGKVFAVRAYSGLSPRTQGLKCAFVVKQQLFGVTSDQDSFNSLTLSTTRLSVRRRIYICLIEIFVYEAKGLVPSSATAGQNFTPALTFPL